MVAIGDDRPLSGTFYFSVSRWQDLRFHMSRLNISQISCFILATNLIFTGSVCASNTLTPCHSIAAERPKSCLSPDWHSAFRHALSQINNLLHNILVWTGGEIPADWNMWKGFDCVDPHFPYLHRSLPPLCLPSPLPSISPNPSLPLHTLQESSHVGSQSQTWVGQAFLWCAQTCS